MANIKSIKSYLKFLRQFWDISTWKLGLIIMLAYLYCAAYTNMTMNESSPPCEQRRITFNDDGRECSWLDQSYQRHITFLCTGCYQLHPHHRLGIIIPYLSPVPIYRPEKEG